MSDQERILAECLHDYHHRRAMGEEPAPTDYRERAGEAYHDLVAVLEAESVLDEFIDPVAEEIARFPMPFGDYTLLSELGRGAVGVVYEAVHRPLGRKVALKVLRTGVDTDSVALERFRREAKACAQVRHENVVEIHDAGEMDGRPWYSMAFRGGVPLSDVLRSEDAPGPRELCRGLAGIADALAALHEAGIVHRDVKPSNIIVEEDGGMVLADFGLARTAASHRLTTTGQTLGTPLYMSPEQALGRTAEVDGRADVYALGATMYEVLTGRPVFRADGVVAMLRMIVKERPESPRAHRPDLPRECERIVMKALEKEKRDRYAGAAEMNRDLNAFAEGREVTGRPVGPVRRVGRVLRRWSPAIAAAVVLAVLSGWLYLTRDATLTVRCSPVAHVTLNGEDRGESPIEGLELPPGEYRMVIAHDGFEPREETIVLEPGSERDIERVLIVSDARDPKLRALIARDLGLVAAELPALSGDRGSGIPSVDVVFPRGRVLAEDLAEWRVDIDRKFRGVGEIGFLAGSEPVWSLKFEPESRRTVAAIPGEVLDALQGDGEITWGFLPEEGEPVTTTFRRGDPEVERRLRELTARLKGQPEAVIRHLTARFLHEEGHHQGAYHRAAEIVMADPEDREAWILMQHALSKLGLEGTRAWNEVQDGLAASKDD